MTVVVTYSPKDLALIEKYRDINVSYDWWDYVFKQSTELLKAMGYSYIDIRFSGFWFQGNNAIFTGYWQPEQFDIEKAKGLVGLQNPWMKEIDRLLLLIVTARLDGRELPVKVHISGKGSINFEYDDGDDSYCMTPHTDHCEVIEDVSRCCMQLIYNDLEAEYDYLTSDEGVKETLDANEIIV